MSTHRGRPKIRKDLDRLTDSRWFLPGAFALAVVAFFSSYGLTYAVTGPHFDEVIVHDKPIFRAEPTYTPVPSPTHSPWHHRPLPPPPAWATYVPVPPPEPSVIPEPSVSHPKPHPSQTHPPKPSHSPKPPKPTPTPKVTTPEPTPTTPMPTTPAASPS